MKISEAIPERVALTQAAEEASELVQALLKRVRFVDPEQRGSVSPDLTEEDSILHVLEELADTLLCIEVVFEYESMKSVIFADQVIEAWKTLKRQRWATRLGIDLDEEED